MKFRLPHRSGSVWLSTIILIAVSLLLIGSAYYAVALRGVAITWGGAALLGALVLIGLLAYFFVGLKMYKIALFALIMICAYGVWLFVEAGDIQVWFPFGVLLCVVAYWLIARKDYLQAFCYLALFLAVILGFQIIIYLSFPYWLFSIVVTFTTFAAQYFWGTIMALPQITRLTLAVIFSVIALQISLVIVLWPINYFTLSLIVVGIILFLSIMAQHFLTHRVSRKTLIQYGVVIGTILLLSILTAPWSSNH